MYYKTWGKRVDSITKMKKYTMGTGVQLTLSVTPNDCWELLIKIKLNK